MTYIDDLIEERFSRSTWWATPKREVQPDDEITTRKRRKDAERETWRETTGGAA